MQRGIFDAIVPNTYKRGGRAKATNINEKKFDSTGHNFLHGNEKPCPTSAIQSETIAKKR